MYIPISVLVPITQNTPWHLFVEETLDIFLPNRMTEKYPTHWRILNERRKSLHYITIFAKFVSDDNQNDNVRTPEYLCYFSLVRDKHIVVYCLHRSWYMFKLYN